MHELYNLDNIFTTSSAQLLVYISTISSSVFPLKIFSHAEPIPYALGIVDPPLPAKREST